MGRPGLPTDRKLLTGNLLMQLNFTSFELENDCSKDYVDILSGSHVRSPSIDKYCGARRPPLLRGRQFVVNFHSDGDGAAAGFNFTVSLAGLSCGGFIHIQSLVAIRTPRYPSAYPANTECEWVLGGQRGHRVNITFRGRFDIQQSAGCARDYIQIFNDVDGSWTSPVKYCGLTNPPTFLSTSHRARLLFRSDASIQGDGFEAIAALACGDNYTDPMGDITSPRYPNEYGGNLNCDYIIVVPQGSHVEIAFDPQFDIEQREDCRYDSLTLYEGPTDSSRQLLRTCGKEAPGNITVSSSVLVRFKTDWSVAGKGFALSYRVFRNTFFLQPVVATSLDPLVPLELSRIAFKVNVCGTFLWIQVMPSKYGAVRSVAKESEESNEGINPSWAEDMQDLERTFPQPTRQTQADGGNAAVRDALCGLHSSPSALRSSH
ncbi:CUB domain-containing protein 2-like [Ornithodoros turicata]|uniref:CUB domain-containing protein 2-like n=1 Tax=Ornithodoros turicata TaxID=34597 RepID=UPI00313A2C5B